MKNKNIRVGIVGVGNIGGAHAHSVSSGKINGMELAALCDSNPEVRKELSKKYPLLPVFASYESLIDSGLADGVIIATPHYFHPEIAIYAFRKGLHVLSEKPAGVYTSAVRKMIAAAEESGKTFAVMFNQRTNKLFSKAKEIMENGTLGELKRVVWIITNWYRKQEYYDSGLWRGTWAGEGGGVLINQAPHNLDLWQWICGMPVSVSAECNVGKYHDIAVEDEAILKAHYKNGATALFITSTGDYPGTNRLEITGTKGKMVLENGKLFLHLCEMEERHFCQTPQPVKNPVTVTEIADAEYNGHLHILQNFANAIRFGDSLISPGAEAINELELSNAAYLSSWLGKEIPLPVDETAFEKMLKEKILYEKKSEKVSQNPEQNLTYMDRWNTNW